MTRPVHCLPFPRAICSCGPEILLCILYIVSFKLLFGGPDRSGPSQAAQIRTGLSSVGLRIVEPTYCFLLARTGCQRPQPHVFLAKSWPDQFIDQLLMVNKSLNRNPLMEFLLI
eukprot:COSAG02_NODE_1266_length_13539_cov_216.818824_13_plen_114_part_00